MSFYIYLDIALETQQDGELHGAGHVGQKKQHTRISVSSGIRAKEDGLYFILWKQQRDPTAQLRNNRGHFPSSTHRDVLFSQNKVSWYYGCTTWQ